MEGCTQRKAARQGTITDKMKDVMAAENVSAELLLERMAKGEVVIPANINHRNLKGRGIGRGLTTKINVNLGMSEDCPSPAAEMKKVRTALARGADSIMDLSTTADAPQFRRRLLAESTVMIGTVPIYEAAVCCGKEIADLTLDDWFGVVERQAEEGVDFMTIHAGLTQTAVERLKKNPRLTRVVSRGGSILLEWMERNGRENPFYEHFDRLLEICRRYDVTLSLGDGLRPGSLADATDAPQIQELIFLGELTLRAWEEDVQVMIEGPGHVPLNEVVANMQLQKKLCHGAPFYVLGPLVTDVAPGYDHITSAIGGALAAASGADFICYVTPAEHLRLPTLEDMKEGIIAARIAAHAADIAKGIPNADEWDRRMSKARAELDWPTMFKLAIDPEKAEAYRRSAAPVDEQVCSMCGRLCAVKKSRQVLGGV